MKLYPFVRYAQILIINSKKQFNNLKAYDNRLFYCIDGRGEIIIDGMLYKMSKGTVLIWQPGCLYSFVSNEGNPLKLIGLNFDFTNNNADKSNPVPPAKAEEFCEKLIVEKYYDEIFCVPVYLKNMEELERDLFNIRREYKEIKNFYSQIITGYLISVLTKIKRAYQNDSKKVTNRIDDIINYICEHYKEDLSNKRLGEVFNYHPNYINRMLKAHTNMTLHQYVLSHRISVALKLIQTTIVPISEIALESGFSDFSHFSKYFKKKIGRNPTDFRRV